MLGQPVLHSTNMAPVAVTLESDLAKLPCQTYQNGTTCFANDSQTLFVWDSVSAAGTVAGVSVAVATGGAWLAVASSTNALDVNSVTGAGLSLKNVIPAAPITAVVKGYYTPGDGGGGPFYWDSTSVAVDDGGLVVRPTLAVIGAWIRIFSGALQVKWFGAKFDNVQDDTTFIQACINALGTTAQARTGQIDFPNGGTALISATLTVNRKFATINGPGPGSSVGGGCALRWGGIAGISMLKVTQCNGLTIRGLRFIGNTATPPSAAIELNAFAGNSPPLTDILLENLWIGGMSGFDAAVPNGFTKGITTSGADLQVDQSAMRDITCEDIIDACIDIANPQNTVWKIDHVVLNAAAIGIRSGSRWIKVSNILCTTITTACYELTNDGNIWVENFGNEGCVRLLQGATGAGARFVNGYWQSTLGLMPGDNRIVNVTTSAFTLFIDNVSFTRNGVFAAGQEKIYVRSTDGVVRFSPDSHFPDFPITLDSAHFDLDTIAAANTFQVWWGEQNYYNEWVNGATLKVGQRNDVATASTLASGAVIQGVTNAGATMQVLRASNDANNRTLVGSATGAVEVNATDLIMDNNKTLQWLDAGGVARTYINGNGTVMSIGHAGLTALQFFFDIKPSGAGIDIVNWRIITLNQATSRLDFTETGHNTHQLRCNAIDVLTMNDNAGATGGLGFFTHAPAARPTVTGALVDLTAAGALKSLLTALAGLGLLVDNST